MVDLKDFENSTLAAYMIEEAEKMADDGVAPEDLNLDEVVTAAMARMEALFSRLASDQEFRHEVTEPMMIRVYQKANS